ncbi:hypothetical protein ABZV64_07335 [Streptomyces sp. NPDC004959]|uniref:hypothetical protein n=1 Tax=Streptomyces sp. NPDC004959 TaxID=3154673 RepID=UPI0033A98CC8
MSPVLVASDLDRTLIYSSRALALTGPDEQAPRLLCVEVYRGEPLSYVTETAAALLTELAARTAFVPTTTRTPAQYARVHLPGPPPRFAICANGGRILVDGESDPAWSRRVERAVADGSAPLAAMRERLLDGAEPTWLLKERVAEDLFAYLVVDRALLPADWLDETAAWAHAHGWTVSLQGRKLYAVPRALTKSAALREVADRTGATLTLAAGDSLLDADLLTAADRAWRPGHGELADQGWRHEGVTALEEVGAAAGEEIVRRFLKAATEEERSGG